MREHEESSPVSQPVPTALKMKIQSFAGNCQTISTSNLLQVTVCCTLRYTRADQPELPPPTALELLSPSRADSTARDRSSRVHHCTDAWTMSCKTSTSLCASVWSATACSLTVRTQKPTVSVKRIWIVQNPFNSAKDGRNEHRQELCPAATNVFLKSLLPNT